jgi:hypothetical protein
MLLYNSVRLSACAVFQARPESEFLDKIVNNLMLSLNTTEVSGHYMIFIDTT